jgi:DNA-binding NtrC family response regulator
MTNETPYESTSANGRRSDEATQSTNGSIADFPSSREFARFIQHAERLDRDGAGPQSLRAWIDLAEAWRITQVLRACKGNRSAAARELGIGRRTLYSKMEKLEITPTWTI